jgi:hypothetical protein
MKKILQKPANKTEAVIHLVLYSLLFVAVAYWWLPIYKALNGLFSQLNFAFAYFFAGPALLVLFLNLSHHYIRAAKVFVLHGKIKVKSFCHVYLLTYLTMASSFWFGASSVELALFHLKESILQLDVSLILFFFIAIYFFSNLIFKTFCLQDIDKNKCAENMAGLFSGTGICLWCFFIFLFYRGGQENDFIAAYPNAVFNYKANDFVWYTFLSVAIFVSYLLTLRFNKHARAVVVEDTLLPSDGPFHLN